MSKANDNLAPRSVRKSLNKNAEFKRCMCGNICGQYQWQCAQCLVTGKRRKRKQVRTPKFNHNAKRKQPQ